MLVFIRTIIPFLALRLLASSAPDPAGYIGSKSCFGCHQSIYRSFAKTDMGNSARLAEDVHLSIPNDPGVAEGTSGKVLRVFREGDTWYQSESEAGVFTEQYKLEYAIGSGFNGITFLVRRGSYLFQAPLSFYSNSGKWNLSPGYENTNIGFSRAAPEACLACHTGRARPVANRNGEYADPPFQELAIGCENCHGPGSNHAASPSRSGSITNPAKLPPRLAEDICINCHQRGDTRVLQAGKSFGDFRPGQPLLETLAIFNVASPAARAGKSDLLEHDSAMKASRCFRASGGKLSCFTCHDPHTQPRGTEAVAYYRAKCMTCHTDASCTLAKQERLKQDSQDSCTGCHMPKRDVASISHSALTNHRIPASATTISPAAEDAPYDNTGLILIDPPFGKQVPVQELTLLRAYAELASEHSSFRQRYIDLLQRLSQTQPNEPLVQAALGHKALAQGQSEEALTHLRAAISLNET
jgi:Cytochrome c554 and c-prime